MRRRRQLEEVSNGCMVGDLGDLLRFCRIVTLSAFGSSIICMPNTSMSSVFARLKTSLNMRVCDPSTANVRVFQRTPGQLTFLADILPLDWLP
jgi:hypothetical protein